MQIKDWTKPDRIYEEDPKILRNLKKKLILSIIHRESAYQSLNILRTLVGHNILIQAHHKLKIYENLALLIISGTFLFICMVQTIIRLFKNQSFSSKFRKKKLLKFY